MQFYNCIFFVAFSATTFNMKSIRMYLVKGRVNRMKTNISALMSLISEQERYLSSRTYSIKGYAMNTSVEELDGRINVVEDNKEAFDQYFDEIEKGTKELSRLKTILYQKNNEFKLSDGRSIQQAIVDNTNLRKLKSTYEQLLLLKSSKKRVTEVHNSYFECRTVNFDSKQLRKRLEEVDSKIQKTDFEISRLNSVEFEI